MNENIYERINQTLSWKRVVAFNLMLLLVLVVPVSLRLAQEDTENRSGAAGELEPSPIIPPPNYPAEAPTIERVVSFFGKTGDTVVLVGNNFGDYQWGSKVYVGNAEVGKEGIVRWSPTILELKIPDSARTGKVWVSVNGNKAEWEGNLVLYDSVKSTQVGIEKVNSTNGRVFVRSGSMVTRGMVELAYLSEPILINPEPGVRVVEQTPRADKLGKKILVRFEVEQALPATTANLFSFSYPGIGAVEIIRSELLDGSGRITPLHVDPLAAKLMP